MNCIAPGWIHTGINHVQSSDEAAVKCIIIGNLWGFAFKEWRGVSRTTFAVVWCGILLLIGSTAVIGWGNSMGAGTAAY